MLNKAKNWVAAAPENDLFYKQTGTMMQIYPWDKSTSNEANFYTDVSASFNWPTRIYVVLNLFALLVYGLDLCFKGEKGVLRVLKIIMLFWPFYVTVIITWYMYLKHNFAGQVCLCQYKDVMDNKLKSDTEYQMINKYYKGTNQLFYKGYPNASDYLCDHILNTLVTVLLWVEISFTLIYFSLITYHYLSNMYTINFKSVNYFEEQLKVIEMKENLLDESGVLMTQ